MGGAVSPQSASGEGRALEPAADGVYYISTAEQLKEFADKVNDTSGQYIDIDAVLTADIDLSSVCSEEKGPWTPIGNEEHPYTGTFNGQNFKISGLTINSSSANNQGLFGYVTGTVQNLSVSGSVKGNDYVGGVVGQNRGSVEDCDFTGTVTGNSYVGGVVGVVGDSSGSVKNCYNTGAVSSLDSGSGNSVGGVVGYNDIGGSVTNCYNTGSVNGSIEAGGVVGSNSLSATVTNCYNTGEVSGMYVGGVVGYNDGPVKNCYNTGSVSGKISVGGVVGYNSGPVKNCYNTGSVSGPDSVSGSYVGGVVGYNGVTGTVTDCYFLKDTAASGIGNGGGGATPLSAEEFADRSKFSSWTDFDNTWKIEPIFGRPTLQANAEIGGTANNPYKIFTATQLKKFATAVNDGSEKSAHAKLMNNIDLNPGMTYDDDGQLSNPADLTTWGPIGTSSSNSYRGTFDGNGHKIENLYINTTDSGAKNQGLFGYVGSGGIVQNLSVSGSVNGGWYVGGVVGYNNGGTVTGCIFSGSGSVSGVTGSDYVGGVVGQNDGTVENCYNTGSVKGPDSVSGSYVGGVVGDNSGTVENCYNTGSVTVTGSNGRVGGVVGNNEASVTNCYNTGSVSGPDSGFFNAVGGVVGLNSSGDSSASASVTNCYNTGKVTGSADSSDVGGVVGYNSSASVANCYYQTGKGAAVGIGGTTGDNSSQTAAKSLEDFHSGEVAYLLEKGVTDEKPVWGQDLTDKNSLPTLVALDKNAKTVYQVTLKYDHAGAQDKTYYTDDTATPSEQPSRDGYTFDHWDKTEGEGNTITYTAQWTPVEEPEPEPEEPPYTGKYSYEVSTSVGDHGSLTVDRYATEGDEVTIAVSPDEAYKLDDLSVTAHGKDVELVDNGDGTFSFTMPSADVRITATFAEDPDWTPDEPEEPTTDVSDLFSDIAPDAWYKDAVQYAYDNGLMTGVSATEFAPEQTTTRAMIVSILARLEGVTTAEAAGFADVDDNDWYATAVNWAANVGVVNGYEDNTFQPNTAITREQLAAILMNYAAYKGEDVSNRADLDGYTDQPSTWAEEAMSWAVAEGLISGVTNTELQPQGNATRAQVAAILQRLLEA